MGEGLLYIINNGWGFAICNKHWASAYMESTMGEGLLYIINKGLMQWKILCFLAVPVRITCVMGNIFYDNMDVLLANERSLIKA